MDRMKNDGILYKAVLYCVTYKHPRSMFCSFKFFYITNQQTNHAVNNLNTVKTKLERERAKKMGLSLD